MRKLVFGMALLAMVGSANTASAGEACKLLGRFLGLGWSDGYHAHLDCGGGCDAGGWSLHSSGAKGCGIKEYPSLGCQKSCEPKMQQLPTYAPRKVPLKGM